MGDREMMIKLTGGLDPVADVAVLLVPLGGGILHLHLLQGRGQELAVPVGGLGQGLLGQDERPGNKFSGLTLGPRHKRHNS